MAYNNPFPVGYQQFYPQYPVQQPQQNNNSIIWVQGEAGAKSYLVAPNNTVQLWDSERQTIYLKSADASGMPSIKTLDYTIRKESSNPVSGPIGTAPTDVSRKDLELLQSQIDAIKAEIKSYTDSKGEVQ